VIINKCNLISCEDIDNLHKFVSVSSFNSYNSYALLVNSGSKYTYSNKLNDCDYLTDMYNLNNYINHKKTLIYSYTL
jgi:hypothetical protein